MKVVSIDTGNRLIKTPGYVFNSGIVRHGPYSPAIQTDVICVENQYYTITEDRVPYLKDKTQDDTYWILTLFAIAKELGAQEPNVSRPVIADVTLAVGLPPSHLSVMLERFQAYFLTRGKDVKFIYNRRAFCINVKSVMVFPQGFSAAYDLLDSVKEYPRSYIIDIGGYTTDVVMLAFGRPDMSFCESFSFGVIHMDNVVKRVVASQHDVELEDAHIESVLSGKYRQMPEAVRTTITREADTYAEKLFRSLKEKGVDTTINLPIFIGGGSQLFRTKLQEFCPHAIFKTDVRANAIGYFELAVAAINRQ